MKTVIKSLILVSFLSLTNAANAQTVTPTATSTPSVTRNLTCTNNSGTIVVGICGIRDCSVSVVLDGNDPVTVLAKRTKNEDKSLHYKTVKGSTPKCNIVISPLKQGSRVINSATCAKALVGAKCNIQ